QCGGCGGAGRGPVTGWPRGGTAGGCLESARLLEQAGAHALELNVYHVATDPAETAFAGEARVLDVLRAVRAAGRLPLAVKLSPFYSALGHLAQELDLLGADGLVLFNRFYQPDIDPDALEVVPALQLSDSTELRLRLRWLAILHGRVELGLAASGGVHTGLDALKAVMAGAQAVQLVSALLRRGPEHLAVVRADLTHWLQGHEDESLPPAPGTMRPPPLPGPAGVGRAHHP